MAFNNQYPQQSPMAGASPAAERDEFGLTAADYEQMFNEVTVNCVDGHYEVVPTPQPNASSDGLESINHAGGQVQPNDHTAQSGVGRYNEGNLSGQGGTGYPQHGDYQQNVRPTESRGHARRRVQPETRTDQPKVSNHNVGNSGPQEGARLHEHRGSQHILPPDNFATVQPDTRTHQPGASTHDGGNLASQGSTTNHQPGGYQPVIPPNPFAIIGDLYPAPPVGWGSGPDFPGEEEYLDSRPNSFGGYGSTSRSTQFAQHAASRRAATRFDAPSSYTPSAYAPSPYATSSPYALSSSYAPPSSYSPSPHAPSPYAQSSYAQSGSAPSPYADNASYATTHSRPQNVARSHQPRLQTQPSRRQTTVPIEDEEVEEREDSAKEEENEESSGKEEPTVTTKSKKTKKPKTTKQASKTKAEPRIGLTRVNENGELEWFAKANGEGVLAVRHDDIRPELIAIAEAERVALGVEYAHPDQPGPGRHNVTSFYRKHLHWGPNREDRPQNLFAWEEDRVTNPRLRCPGDMYWEEGGREYIVLDPHDNPVKNWDLPLTIASNIPGYKLEAMRRENTSLKHKDFWARMPRRIDMGTPGNPDWQELGHTNSVVNMPIERFRFRAGLCSWTLREGTLKIKEGLKKLYENGNVIQNNSVRAFGRDLTNREIEEIKKGKKAKFPIEDDTVHETRKGTKKRKRQDPAIKEDTQSRTRPRKRARREMEEASIASEVDDLVMQTPTIDQGDAGRRYPVRSTRKTGKVLEINEAVEELENQSSTGEDPHNESDEVGWDLQASSVETDDDVLGINEQIEVPENQSSTGDDPHNESDEVGWDLRASSVETDEDEDRSSPRVPFRRIPGIADVGGKCKGPSWVSSSSEEDRNNDERDRQKVVIPLNIGGRAHYATYEGLISNGPLQSDGASDTVPERQDPDIADASIQQNESETSQLHPFDAMMMAPIYGHENTRKQLTPLEAHRKRVREFLGGEDPEIQLPPSKRLHTLPVSATPEATINVPARIASPPISRPQVEQNGRAPPIPYAQASKIRKQKLDAEWAEVFEQTFLDHGFQSVDYSEVCPCNDEEVQSLVDALLPTREVYLAWTGEPAPRTDPHQSYRAQFDTIFVAFQYWWATHRPNEYLPILSGVVHGGRSIDDFVPPSKDSIYYEAFEKGHRAHRGGPSEYSGPSLEDASRIPY